MTDPAVPTAASWDYSEAFAPESDAAAPSRTAARDLGITPVGQGTASLLTVLAAATGARAVVEIGTGTGVSALALLAGMAPDGVLTSIDTEAQHQAVARDALKRAGVPTQRARLITGAALQILPNLRDGAYDLVLVDGDKLEYVEYVEQATRLLRSGGVLLLDNALWHNKVADVDNEEDETLIVREALEAVRSNDSYRSALVPVGDGLLLAVKA